MTSTARRTRPLSGELRAGDVRLHYVVAGEGDPVVLLHGFLSDSRKAWIRRGMFARLARRYRVVALDARGHGRSDKPHVPSAYGRETARDVVRLLDHLDVGAAHLVGYSMGAHMIAQLLVHAPERALTATLAGAAGRHRWSEADQRLADLEADELERGSLRSQMLRLTPPDEAPPTDDEIRRASRATLRGADPKALAALRRANGDEVVDLDALTRVALPVLGVVGSRDPYLATFRLLEARMSSLELVVVEGGTHRTTAGHPEFVAAVERFLAAHATPWTS